MKRILPVLAAVAMTVVLGCERTTVRDASGRKLTLMKPADQTLTRGETNKVAVTIARSNFDGPVNIMFEDLPKGVKLVEGKKSIEKDDSLDTWTLMADAEADLVTNHAVRIIAEGPEGLRAAETFYITVKEGKKEEPEERPDESGPGSN